MSIFRRDPEAPQPSPPAPRNPREGRDEPKSSATTLIAHGSKVVGEILGDAPVHVAGQLDGRIHVGQTVVVSAQGQVRGEIYAHVARIGGRVEGPVRAMDRVEVTASGHLEGDIQAPRVVIEEGAFFKGQVQMGKAFESRQRPAEQRSRPPVPEERPGKEGEAQARLPEPAPRQEAEKGAGDRPDHPENEPRAQGAEETST